MTPWAVYDPSGELRYIGLHGSENDLWQIFLGWPSAAEIEGHKKCGWKATVVEVRRR